MKSWKKLCGTCIGTAALILSSSVVAQTSTPASASFPAYSTESVGSDFDAAKIQALEARMAQFVEDGDAKGIATLLVKDGKVISHMQSGLRRVSDNAPITEDTIYRIYSMTKPITGAALMTLYKQRKKSQ